MSQFAGEQRLGISAHLCFVIMYLKVSVSKGQGYILTLQVGKALGQYKKLNHVVWSCTVYYMTFFTFNSG